MNKSNLKEGLKKFRKRLDGRYVIEGEYSPDTSVGNADIAKSLLTKRIISDADVACPPITYGIAGGEAEIETGYQKVVKLMGNTVVVDGVVKSAKSAKLVSRGKNQFTAFDEFIDVVGGEEYELSGLESGFHVHEYGADKETETCLDYDWENADRYTLETETRYIKIEPKVSSEVNSSTQIMLYNTFGEVYGEEYEKPVVSELELPNVELFSAGNARDELYNDGRIVRKVGQMDISNFMYDDGCGFAGAMQHTCFCLPKDAVPFSDSNEGLNVFLKGYTTIKHPDNNTTLQNLPSGKYIYIKKYSSYSRVFIIDDNYERDYKRATINAFFASLSGNPLFYEKAEYTYEQTDPFDSNIFIDNFGTILFLDEEGKEVEVEQPYYVEYKVSLVELVDSLYAKLNGDADEVATKTELVEGDVVPAQAVETEKVAPYSEQSGIHVDGEFRFQTSGGDADCSDLARIECIKGKAIKIVSMPLHIQNQNQDYDDNTFNGKIFDIGDGRSGDHWNDFDIRFDDNIIDDLFAISFDVIASGDNILPREGVEYESADFIKIFGHDVNDKLSKTEPTHFFFILKGRNTYNFISNVQNDRIFGELFISNAIAYDLTQMFGKGFEPRTEADFRKTIPEDEFVSRNAILGLNPKQLINTSYNAFDGEFLEYAVGQNGIEQEGRDDDNKATSLIKVLPNTTYGIICDVNSIVNSNLFEFSETTPTQSDEWSDIVLIANQVLTFTTGSKTKYIRLNVPKTTTNLTVFIYWDGSKQVQEPQKVWKYGISTGGMSLLGIGDYQDKYYPDGTIKKHVIEIGQQELDYNLLNSRGQILNDHQFSLYLEDLEEMSGHQFGVDSIKELRFLIDEGFTEIVEEEGEEPYLLVNCIGTDQTDWEHDGYINIRLFIASPNVIFERQTDLTYVSDVSIDDFGTMEWVDQNALINKLGVKQPCVINYVGDYVAFMDTLANREDVQYDAHQLLTKGDKSIAQFFDDKDFIINGKKMCSDPVRVLISPVEKSIKPHRKLRNGSTRSLHPHDYIGKKKFNYITDFYFEDIETLIQDFYGVSDLVSKKLYEFFGEKSIDYQENTDIVFHGDARLYGSNVYICEVDVDYINNEEFHSGGIEYVLNATPSKWFEEILECGFPYEKVFMSDDDKRIKIRKVYKNRIFKFVRNFEFANKTAGLGWKGIMANEGIEMEVYLMSDFNTDAVYLIFRPKKIILK